jgi:WD40 repeat protein/tetratricopeptide (TPR) repeat protein
LFEALLAPDRSESFNRRLIGLDLGCLRQEEVAIALADLQAQGTALPPDLQASVAFARGLNIRNEDAIALFDQSAAHWAGEAGETAALKRGLALFYLGRARYFAADNEKYQTPDWLPAVAPLETALEIFEQAQRPDLMAQGMIPLARVLHRLERWDELEALIQRAIPLHEAHSSPDKLAQDYGFLADVALSRQHWPQAATLAQQALDRVPEESWWRILYLKMLAQAARAQGQLDVATEHLQTAQSLGVREHPKLHSDVLALLQQCLRDQGRYLEAFEVKRERLAVEQQYGLRAFIGAGRLRSRRMEQRATVRSERQSLEAIAPEIAASGRQQDLETLLQRIAGKEHKLIVLHGASGVGKSSLVNGGLLPALHARAMDNRVNVPVLIRQYTDWAGDLTQQLAAALEIQNAKFPISPLETLRVDVVSPLDLQNSEATSQEPEARSQEPNPPAPVPPISPSPYPPNSSTHTPTHPSTHTPTHPSTLPLLQHCEDLTLRPVLIFDQFEEFFFANPDPVARQGFFEFLVDCLELQPSALKIVLSLREDYIHYLLEARQAVRRLDLPEGSMARSQLGDILGKQILYEIGNFSPEDATAIIESLTAGSRLYLEPVLVAALVADLAGPLGEVRPIEMQIVGAQLQTEGIQTLAQYRRLGDQPKETLVQRYLQDVVEDCGEEHRQLAELVLFLLTDERGTRPLKTRPELLQDLKTLGVWEFASNAVMDQRNLDLVLHIICNSGIGVQLPDKPDDRYQLIHDYLAAVIREQQAPQLDKILEALEKETTERLKAEAQKDLLSKANKTLENAAKKARNRVKIASSLLASSIFISTAFMAFTTHFSSQRISSANTIIDLEKELKRISQDLENLTTPSRVEQLELLIKTLLVSGETLDLETSGDLPDGYSTSNSVFILDLILQEIQEKQRFSSKAGINKIRFNFQGDRIIARLNDGNISIWNTQGQELENFSIPPGMKYSDFSSQDLKMISISQENTVRIWSDERQLLKSFTYESPVINASFNEKATKIAILLQDGKAEIWDLKSDELAFEIDFNSGSKQILFSPDNTKLVVIKEDGDIEVLTFSGQRIHRWTSNSVIGGATFSPDSKMIAVFTTDKRVVLWSLKGEKLNEFLHDDQVTDISFSPDGSQILSGSIDGKARAWLLDGREYEVFTHNSAVTSVSFDPTGNYIVSGTDDGKMTLWSLAEKNENIQNESAAWSVNFSPDGSQMIAGFGNGKIKVFSRRGNLIQDIDASSSAQQEGWSAIRGLNISRDGSKLLAFSDDKKIRIWQYNQGRIGELPAFEFYVNNAIKDAKLSPDNQQILIALDNGEALLTSLDGKLIEKFDHGSSSILSVDFNIHDRSKILTASEEGVIKIWSLHSPENPVISLPSDEEDSWTAIRSAMFGTENGTVLSGSWDGKLRLRRLNTDFMPFPNDNHSSSSYDRDYIHGGAVFDTTLSPDGDRIAVASWDGKVTIWNFSGEKVAEFSSESPALSVAFSGDGNNLVLGRLNGEVSVHPVPTLESLLRRGCLWIHDFVVHYSKNLEADLHVCDERW